MTRLFGHDLQTAALLTAARSGRMHHGWILAGPRGIGKATLARMLALRLLAESADPALAVGDQLDIDQDHMAARLIMATAHPDYAELAPLEKEGVTARSISVDQVRGLQRLSHSAPSLSPRRLVVVDSADDLERGAANALLKTLEEPPADMIFLLVSHAPGRLLPTIRSRCRLLRFDPLKDEAMRSALGAAGLELTAREVEALVATGEGSPGRALRYAGLELGEIEATLDMLAREGDPTNRHRVTLARTLSAKSAKPRYEAFLEYAPAFIARTARRRSGAALGQALDQWETARQLAGGALPLSLDPASVVFELAGHVAALAPEARR